jgi:hypothetical protein
MVRALYAVEREASGLAIAERLDMRRKQSVPVLAALRDKFLAWKKQLLPKHPMTEAVNYALGQWQELNVFCSDLDNGCHMPRFRSGYGSRSRE